jgi:hypothetical protein
MDESGPLMMSLVRICPFTAKLGDADLKPKSDPIQLDIVILPTTDFDRIGHDLG